MWRKLFQHKSWLAFLGGLCFVLAAPPIEVIPLSFVIPIFLSALAWRCQTVKSGFRWGFLTSFVMMVGVFYWITYVIHEFGYLPWAVSGFLFLGFCGFGALNFPVFIALAVYLQDRWQIRNRPAIWTSLWFALGLPTLFTLIEYFVPKLFPWFLGHLLYRTPWTTQIAELTGTTFLTFSVYCAGSVASQYLLAKVDKDRSLKPVDGIWAIPLLLWIVCIGFSVLRLNAPPLQGKSLKVALIQANIGSLEKVAAERGLKDRVQIVMNRYKALTEDAVRRTPKPDLVVWPETAIPFQLESHSPFAEDILSAVADWQVPLLTGAYAPVHGDQFRDYNAAYLVEPERGKQLGEIYYKNVLLAFGEYMPFGESFPKLYEWFPQISNFARGKDQRPVLMRDGTRLGVTICYEAILPGFYRNVAKQDIQAVINLTNDSWFGPTSEPYQHAALTVFRAIETRMPMARATNTGLSFTVDERGRMSERTGVYKEGILFSEMVLPLQNPRTFYVRYGDWFIGLLLLIMGATALAVRKQKLA